MATPILGTTSLAKCWNVAVNMTTDSGGLIGHSDTLSASFQYREGFAPDGLYFGQSNSHKQEEQLPALL